MAADSGDKPSQGSAMLGKDADDESTPKIKSTELRKIDDLAENIDRVLTGTLHGEFYEGTKSSNAIRHKQMPEIFALRAETQEVKNSVERKGRREAEENESQEAKAPSKLNGNWTAAVKNLISEQLTEQLRDMSIEQDRLKARVAKAEKEKEELADKVHLLENKSRKANEKPPCTLAQYQALVKKVATLESDLKKHKEQSPCTPAQYQALAEQVTSLEAGLALANKQSSHADDEHIVLGMKVDGIRDRLDRAENTNTALRTGLDREKVTVAQLLEKCDAPETGLTALHDGFFAVKETTYGLAADRNEHKEWIENLEEIAKSMESWGPNNRFGSRLDSGTEKRMKAVEDATSELKGGLSSANDWIRRTREWLEPIHQDHENSLEDLNRKDEMTEGRLNNMKTAVERLYHKQGLFVPYLGHRR